MNTKVGGAKAAGEKPQDKADDKVKPATPAED